MSMNIINLLKHKLKKVQSFFIIDKLNVKEHDQNYLKAKSAHPIEIIEGKPLIFSNGDSISVGYAPHLKKACSEKANIIHRIDAYDFYPGIKFPNYTGLAVSLILWTKLILKIESNLKPNVLMLNCGLHDINRGKSARRYKKDIETLINMAIKNNVQLIWVTTTPREPNYEKNDLIIKFNSIATNACILKSVPVIDLHGYITNLLAKNSWKEVFEPDGVHFLKEVYQKQGEWLATELEDIEVQKYLN